MKIYEIKPELLKNKVLLPENILTRCSKRAVFSHKRPSHVCELLNYIDFFCVTLYCNIKESLDMYIIIHHI